MERCVLVVDDNPEMLTMTHNAWAQQGYAQRCVKTGEEAVGNLISAQKFKRDFRLIALVADYLDERLIPMVKLVRHISDLPLLVLSSEYHAGIRPAGTCGICRRHGAAATTFRFVTTTTCWRIC